MIGTVLNDRYSIQSLIGRGGMGAVYQAEDILLERPVAIKVVSATDLGTEGRTRLLQEARTAARINHPNIVAVFDIGQAEFKDQPGCSYIVMELVRGQTLRDAMPQDLDRIIDIAIKICQALAAAEQHGIIHRDLKPENIMIADGDSIKLMDFGLARISGKARLTQEGTLMGTLSYLAPEVILGQEADPRSDLYALGVTLYEMSAGRPPFEADNLTSVISQHLIAPIVPPSAYNDRIPPVLDQLIIQLLGKHPEDRPSSAEAVQVALEDISKASFVSQTVQPIPQLNRLIRGRMVGREQELAEAHACWNQASSGRGQVLLVSGEPGIGKTRLIHELITLVRVSGGRVLSGASYAEGGAPYAPFSQILREGLREEDLSLSGELLAGLLTLVPELRSRYPQLPDRTPGDPQEEQQCLLDNIVHYFSLLSGCAPLLLVLEDAHWADSGTVSLLRHLARGCRLQPLMVAATYREVEIDEARALHKALLDMQRERLAVRIKLSRLDREGTRALMATLFDEAIAPDFLEGIYHETEGNPFFIEEICKALVESGQLVFKDGRWHRPSIEKLGIPQSIRVAIQARAGALSATSRKALEQAAHTLMKLGLVYNNAFDFAQSRQAYQEGFALWQQTSIILSADSAKPASHPLRLRLIEPTSLDQALVDDTASGIYIDQLSSGLLQLTPEMDVIPDVAHSWEVLEAGRRYRFHLRDDVFWSDGVQVTAADFDFALRRVLAPEQGSQNAPHFFTIKNGRDFHEGRILDWGAVGVKVIDPLTLEFVLENPDSTFLFLVSQFAFAVPRHRLLDPGAQWMDWDELVTNGPFSLADWEPGQRLRLETNPSYHGHRFGNVQAVEIDVPARPGDVESLELYEADLADMVVLTLERAVRAGNRYASDHLQYSTLSTAYIGFNTRKGPFADPRVRRAMALATDRERLTAIFLQGLSFPASGGFIPPGMPGHVAGIALPYNPERARRLLAEAGYGEQGAILPVEFLMGENYANFKINEYLSRQWQETLGLEIKLVQLPWPRYLERLQAAPPAIHSMAWTADFPDPNNFLGQSSFRKYTGWHNEAYGHLIQQARQTLDQKERMVLYRQAEDILVEETPILPINYGRLSMLIKPWVRRFPCSPLKFWYWKDVVIEPH